MSEGKLRAGMKYLNYRDPNIIDTIVGKARRAVQIGTAFFDWPLWRAYPTWHQYDEQIAIERATAKAEGRDPHPSAAPPPPADNFPQLPAAAPMFKRRRVIKGPGHVR